MSISHVPDEWVSTGVSADEERLWENIEVSTDEKTWYDEVLSLEEQNIVMLDRRWIRGYLRGEDVEAIGTELRMESSQHVLRNFAERIKFKCVHLERVADQRCMARPRISND